MHYFVFDVLQTANVTHLSFKQNDNCHKSLYSTVKMVFPVITNLFHV